MECQSLQCAGTIFQRTNNPHKKKKKKESLGCNKTMCKKNQSAAANDSSEIDCLLEGNKDNGKSAVTSPIDQKQISFHTEMFESLPGQVQFVILTMSMFLFFGAHNLLQEAMMRIPGFKHGVMLGYMEVLGGECTPISNLVLSSRRAIINVSCFLPTVVVCCFIERKYITKETGHVAPLRSYTLLTACLMSSTSLSNMSLNYINFPTKVVFRSCKLIPTMIISTIINKRVFQSAEYVSAMAISLGLVIFAAADWKMTPSFNPIGLLMVSSSVIADAILPNAQERLFRLGSSRLEVTLFTNFFTLVAMTVTTLLSGDLIGIFKLAMSNGQLATFMITYTCISYVAISTFMTIVKRYGGVTAVLLGTARKAMSIMLSFLLFPKPFTWYYAFGAILVLGGLLAASLLKQRLKNRENINGVDRQPLVTEKLEKDIEAGQKNLKS